MKIGITLLLATSLAACNRDEPPAPSTDQSARLDEAETMLNEMAGNEEGAAPEDTAPSSLN